MAQKSAVPNLRLRLHGKLDRRIPKRRCFSLRRRSLTTQSWPTRKPPFHSLRPGRFEGQCSHQLDNNESRLANAGTRSTGQPASVNAANNAATNLPHDNFINQRGMQTPQKEVIMLPPPQWRTMDGVPPIPNSSIEQTSGYRLTPALTERLAIRRCGSTARRTFNVRCIDKLDVSQSVLRIAGKPIPDQKGRASCCGRLSRVLSSVSEDVPAES